VRPSPTLPPVAPPQSNLPLGLLIGGVAVGALIALLTSPAWVPIIAASLVGTEPKAAWYLSRASAFVAFALLWVSMVSGLIITNKMARVWPGVFTAFDLHQYTSLLGLGFATFHALVLLGDQYITYNLAQLLVPFASGDYRPLWVGLGQVALYISILVTFTFYIRKQIGNWAWHVIHLLSYAMFALALLHGMFSGTDSGNAWVSALYWAGGFSLLFLTIYRVLITRATAPAR
jgi:predicted ferric reductase